MQEFLNTCDYEAKREPEGFGPAEHRSGFEKLQKPCRPLLKTRRRDAESIKAVFSRLNSEILNLDPLVLPASVPKMPPVKANVDNYDRLFLKGALQQHEN